MVADADVLGGEAFLEKILIRFSSGEGKLLDEYHKHKQKNYWVNYTFNGDAFSLWAGVRDLVKGFHRHEQVND